MISCTVIHLVPQKVLKISHFKQLPLYYGNSVHKNILKTDRIVQLQR